MVSDFDHAPADIAYHDYLAVLCAFDDAQSLHMGGAPLPPDNEPSGLFKAASRKFTTACQTYAQRVQNHADDFFRANRANAATVSGQISRDTTSPKLANYLYNPAMYLSFGNSDASALLLLDSFDPVLWITAEVGALIEQTILAFCPTLESLGLDDHPHFCELDELLSHRKPLKLAGNSTEGQRECSGKVGFEAADHPFQFEAPLVAVTRYKTSGILPLGHGLLIQQAIFRTIARKIDESLARLEQYVATIGESHALTSQDIKSVRVALLDPQGSEDIATVIACRNYTVAITIITALRSLTIRDLLAVDENRLRQAIQSDHIHTRVLDSLEQLKSNQERPASDILEGNHVFSVTYTSLGVSYPAYFEPYSSTTQVNGYLAAFGLLDILPGHLTEAEGHWVDAAKKSPLRKPIADITEVMPPLDKTEDRSSALQRTHRFILGRHDFIASFGVSHEKMHKGPVIHVKDFLSRVRGILREFKCAAYSADSAAESEIIETGLRDFSSMLVVPFPELGLLENVVPELHFPLLPVFEATKRHLFSPGGAFDKKRLQDSMREIHLPRSLRRTITYLFENYGDCIGAPARFHMVLDLHDAFVTLYLLLTEQIPSQQANAISTGHARERHFSDQMVDDLVRFLNALENAISHREYLAVATSEERDTGVDLRGGVNKLIHASDVSLKCGINVVESVRQARRKRAFSGPSSAPLNQHVSAVARIAFHPQTIIRWLDFGMGDGLQLARVNMNAVHLFRPEDHAYYLHEAAHLLWPHSATNNVDAQGGGDNLDRMKLKADRKAELFAELVVHLFIFGNSTTTYLRRFLSRASMVPCVIDSNDEITRERLVEILIRAFLVSDAVSHHDVASPWQMPFEHRLYNPSNQQIIDSLRATEVGSIKIIQDAWSRFSQMIVEAGPFFSKFDSMWWRDYGKIVQRSVEDEFPFRFQDAFGDMTAVWSSALGVFKDFYNEKYSQDPQKAELERDELIRAFKGKAFPNGRPIIFHRPTRDPISDVSNCHDPQGYEREFFKCQLMCAYLEWCFKQIDPAKELHTCRTSNGGHVTYSQARDKKKGWNKLHFDRDYGGFFCVDPQIRRDLLKCKIVIMKTLWDLSTSLRTARFHEVFDEWKDC